MLIMSFAVDVESVLMRVSNRRAKIKLLAKKSIETGEDCDAIPESMRQYLAIQAMESGKPLARSLSGRSMGPMIPYGNAGMLLNGDQNNPSKVGTFSCKDCDLSTWITRSNNCSQSSITLPVDP